MAVGQMVEGTEELCGRFTDYSLKYVRVIHESCKRGIPTDLALGVVKRVCSVNPMEGTPMVEDIFSTTAQVV